MGNCVMKKVSLGGGMSKVCVQLGDFGFTLSDDILHLVTLGCGASKFSVEETNFSDLGVKTMSKGGFVGSKSSDDFSEVFDLVFEFLNLSLEFADDTVTLGKSLLEIADGGLVLLALNGQVGNLLFSIKDSVTKLVDFNFLIMDKNLVIANFFLSCSDNLRKFISISSSFLKFRME